ncbi:MAG: site-specific DNA-methyltransferase [Oscillospiraceae bacterium]|nr:site-specific DNA-methyltransferase [Oscillospiraceae bacterium]
MKTILKFDTRNKICLPQEFEKDDVRFSDSFAEYFIKHFTKSGDTVFDPFAGFGTTLYIAEKLDRRAFGVELLPERVEFIKENLRNQSGIICDSSLQFNESNLPEIDFVLTSPPYMQRINHPEYPFAGYQITGQGYEDYLIEIAEIFNKIKKRLKYGSYVVIEVSNLLIDGVFTPLAWDIAGSVCKELVFKQEIIIEWEPTYGFGYDHSYAFIFQNI